MANLDKMTLSQMYDRLHEFKQRPESFENNWEIADVTEAIEQTVNGEW